MPVFRYLDVFAAKETSVMDSVRFVPATLWTLLTLANSTFAADTAGARHYVWLTAGKPSGEQIVETLPDGRTSIRFHFDDRGRGPDTTTEVTLDGDGVPTSFRAAGVNYAKARVEERFELKNGLAVWRSSLESGQRDAADGAFYFAANQPPEYLAMLARALLTQPDRELSLIPGGSARIRKANDLTVPMNGTTRQANLYEIRGLGLSPEYVWLDRDRQLIGFDMGWFALLETEWVPHLAALKSAQQAALAAFVEGQARRFSERIEQPIAITNVRILDVAHGTLTEPATVVVRNGRIAGIGHADGDVPEGARTIEGGGRTLMPALWDMHGHIRPSQYLHYLASGVLNVRDMANDPDYIASARREIEAGAPVAPDIHAMGFIDKRGPFSAPTGRLAETLDQALGHVRSYAAEGYAGIKLYSSVDPQWVSPLTQEASRLGLPTAGHIPSQMSAAQAISAGYTEVTHINMILLQLLGDTSVDTRTPQRFTVPGELGWRIDLSAKETDQFVDMLKSRGVAHDPTLAIFMDQYLSRPGDVLPRAVDYADHLPPALYRAHIAAPGYSEGKEAAFRRTGARVLQLVKLLHDRGIRLLPGTDANLPGFTLISELAYYAAAGIPTADVLRIATIEPARHMGAAERLGSVDVGKQAYLMLIDGDPTQDIQALRNVGLVLKGDVLIRPRDILLEQGITPFGES